MFDNLTKYFSENCRKPAAGKTAYRQAAYDKFLRSGWPVKDSEDWKYTSLKSLKEKNLKVIDLRSGADNSFEPYRQTLDGFLELCLKMENSIGKNQMCLLGLG